MLLIHQEFDSTSISPPCISRIDLTTDNPNPAPPVPLLREDSSLKNLSNIFL